MKFRLIDKDGKAFHEAVMPTPKRPEAITWAHRAFLFDSQKDDTPVYREATAYRIGSSVR